MRTHGRKVCGQVRLPIDGDHSTERDGGRTMNLMHMAVAVWWEMSHPRTNHDERGLSQSTENAILLAGAVTVAVLIVTVITAYVRARLPS